MSTIKIDFKMNTQAMFRKMGQVKFINAARRWGSMTAIKLEFEAKKNAPVDMGRLKSSITHRVIEGGNNVIARTGSNVEYAAFQEFGTGIYGPRKQVIRPKTAKVLAWQNPRRLGGGWNFAMSVKGVKPRKFFQAALRATRDWSKAVLDEQIRKEMER